MSSITNALDGVCHNLERYVSKNKKLKEYSEQLKSTSLCLMLASLNDSREIEDKKITVYSTSEKKEIAITDCVDILEKMTNDLSYQRITPIVHCNFQRILKCLDVIIRIYKQDHTVFDEFFQDDECTLKEKLVALQNLHEYLLRIFNEEESETINQETIDQLQINFINNFFNLLEGVLKEIVMTEKNYVSSVINGHYDLFVDRIIEGLNSAKDTYFTAFFKQYTKQLDPSDMEENDLRCLQEKVCTFIQSTHYQSKPSLSSSFARIYRSFSNRDLAPKSINKEAKNFFIKDSSQCSNSQIDRYRAEIAAKILNKIVKNIQQLKICKGQHHLVENELRNFISSLETTNSLSVIIFKFLNDRDLAKIIKRKELLVESVKSGLRDHNEFNEDIFIPEQGPALLHPFVRKFLNAGFSEKNKALLWSLFSKFNDTSVSENYQKAIICFIKELKSIENMVNPTGIGIIYGEEFYQIIVEAIKRRIERAGEQNAEKLIEITSEIRNLESIISQLMDKHVNLVDFKDVCIADVLTVMSDKNMSLKEIDFLKLSQELGTDFSHRLHLYALFVKNIKPMICFDSYYQSFFDSLGVSKDDFVKSIKSLEPSKAIESPFEALKILVLHTLKKGINIANATDTHYKIDQIKHFLTNFSTTFERAKARYKYSFNAVLDAYNTINKTQHDQATTEQFIHRLNDDYSKALAVVKPFPIEWYEHNQALAIYEAIHKVINVPGKRLPKPLFLNIHTGNGKTLVEATIAAEYVKKHPDPAKKVFIFTSFDHLAARDQQAMQAFYTQHLGEQGHSCCINSEEDLINLKDNTRIIYADMLHFLRIGHFCVTKNNINESIRNSFLKLLYSDWSSHLVLLDEFDILFDLPELDYFYEGKHWFWEGSLTQAAKQKILQELQQGSFDKINQFFNFNTSNQLSPVGEETISKTADQAGNVSQTYSSTIGVQLQKHDALRILQPVPFSLKKVLRKTNLIGFSGSVDVSKFVDNYEYIFPDLSIDTIIKVPLFYDPQATTLQSIKPKSLHFNNSQLPDALDWPNWHSALKHPALKETAWLDSICKDVESAIKDNQPVMIFADDNQIEKIKDHIKNSLKITPLIFTKTSDAADRRLQEIAHEGAVAICNKKVGRGADVRIPREISKGLHIIISRPDYNAEIIQEIGRTGRMNRPGSFSLIFKEDDNIPIYREDASKSNDRNLYKQVVQELSKKFYIEGSRSQEEIKKFAWFQTVCWYCFKDKIAKETSADRIIEQFWSFIKNNILK